MMLLTQLPGSVPSKDVGSRFGSAFLLDVHMDSGRLLKPWVSSLGAFWPAMQVLAGACGVTLFVCVCFGGGVLVCDGAAAAVLLLLLW